MSQKLYTVQAVSRVDFERRPPVSPFMPSDMQPVLNIPPVRRATVFQVSKKKAREEAERLAQQNPELVFLVMESTLVAYNPGVVTKTLEG